MSVAESVAGSVAESVAASVLSGTDGGSTPIERTMGMTTDGATGPTNLTQDFYWLTGTYSPEVSGELQSIHLFTNEAGIGTKLCIYEDDGGSPGALVASTGQLVSTAGGWISDTISGSIDVAKSYWIGWLHDTTGMMMAYDATKTTKYLARDYTLNFEDPFPGGEANLTRQYPAYVTYLG